MKVAIDCLGSNSSYTVARWIAEYLNAPIAQNPQDDGVYIGNNLVRSVMDGADVSFYLEDQWSTEPFDNLGYEVFDTNEHNVVFKASSFIRRCA